MRIHIRNYLETAMVSDIFKNKYNYISYFKRRKTCQKTNSFICSPICKHILENEFFRNKLRSFHFNGEWQKCILYTYKYMIFFNRFRRRTYVARFYFCAILARKPHFRIHVRPNLRKQYVSSIFL